MEYARASRKMQAVSGDPLSVDTDLVFLAAFEGELDALSPWAAATRGELSRAVERGEVTGKAFETFLTPVASPQTGPRLLGVVGMGQRQASTNVTMRRAATAAGLAARQRRIDSVAFAVPEGSGSDATQAAAEGLMLAAFDGARYKTQDHRPFTFRALRLVVPAGQGPAVARAVARGAVLGAHANLARELANEPGNRLTPSTFAEQLSHIARDAALAVEVLDRDELERRGMNLLLAVGSGSAEAPRLVVIRYDPPGAPASPVLGFVGKGITFDTGGISIKPAADMERMKDDMTGGATVACALHAMAELEMPQRAIGVIPIAENMPGGRALRPGDVIRSASGKTVEVVNTDAEGRLILADALWYARELGATHLIDIATLTGAISVVFGRVTTGLFGQPPAFVDLARGIAERAGERVWPLPLFDEYRDQLRSDIADMINTAGKLGGAITAAQFLKEFTGGLPWIHLDIAGTAWADDATPYMPKGPTGVAAGLLVEIAEAIRGLS